MPGHHAYRLLTSRAGTRRLRHVSLLRSVHTWTPLAAAFNRKPEQKILSIFDKKRRGLFGNPLLADASGFYLLKEQAEIDSDALVREATSTERTRNVVEIFDELSDVLCRVADLAECVRLLHGESNFAQAAEEAHSSMSNLVEQLNTNRPLYNSLRKCVEKGDIKPMDDVDKHTARLFLVDFELAGIHLEEAKRRRVVQLNSRILSAGSKFLRRCYEPRYVKESQVPEEIKPYFEQDAGHLVVTNLMSDAPSETIREAAFRAYLMPDQHQLEPLKDLLDARNELAHLVGKKSYSERANQESIFNNVGTITSFLNTLSEKIAPIAKEEYVQMLALKKRLSPQATEVYPWDTAYLTALLRKEGDSGMDNAKLSQFFPLGACIDGLSHLFQSIYGVRLAVEDTSAEDLWSPDVYKLSARDENDEVLGYIYCDLYERAGKAHQDCHFTIRGGRQLSDGSYQTPTVVLSLNYQSPSGRLPSLMPLWSIDNLFHEMGHAMHSMIGRTRYQHVTGTRCSTDFAEIPSTLMEFFSGDSRVLSRISRHYQSGQSLSEDILYQALESRKQFSVTELQQQAFYSILDQAYHGSTVPKDLNATFAELHAKHVTVQYVHNTAWQLRFGHLFSYGARYYSYLLSRAVASDIWLGYFKKDPFDREGGVKVREGLLKHGGGKPPLELVSNVLQHKPDVQELVSALVQNTKKA
ncbi:hypothetical protein RvY_15550 [Ramazzottius varieornatus]|uniref:Peptidase M3A/M3B catalytic domain-containing protein n=1 Tax=Ramazzottius varieornatus TaxID=947166 RepID=A0A1D1VVB4_RAMVA|nr:hypothetical protein RvY_15550 [Ramazzottius varieornatus]